jgi:hypothetical protein
MGEFSILFHSINTFEALHYQPIINYISIIVIHHYIQIQYVYLPLDFLFFTSRAKTTYFFAHSIFQMQWPVWPSKTQSVQGQQPLAGPPRQKLFGWPQLD